MYLLNYPENFYYMNVSIKPNLKGVFATEDCKHRKSYIAWNLYNFLCKICSRTWINKYYVPNTITYSIYYTFLWRSPTDKTTNAFFENIKYSRFLTGDITLYSLNQAGWIKWCHYCQCQAEKKYVYIKVYESVQTFVYINIYKKIWLYFLNTGTLIT